MMTDISIASILNNYGIFNISYDYLFFIITLLSGIFLDRLWGDPELSIHPVRLIGRQVSTLEKHLNHGNFTQRLRNGFFTVFIVVITVGVGFTVIAEADNILHHLAGSFFSKGYNYIINILPYLLYTSIIFLFIASEGLIREGMFVFYRPWESIEEGRRRLSRIVGRDTSGLDGAGINRAVLETMSENLSDGVIAPLFYLVLGGIPLMAIYKAINTMDSMIGYRNDRFEYFGRAAARLDDLANYIPSRITAVLMVIVSGKYSVFAIIQKYARLHESPNAGYPESALAGILGIRLGGPAVYHGYEKRKAWLGTQEREPAVEDLYKTVIINRRSLYLFTFLILIVRYVIGMLSGGVN